MPLEIVFRECTAADVIHKLRELGCEVNRSNERGAFDPDIDGTSNLVTQSLRVRMKGIKPFGGPLTGPFLAWRDDSDECSFAYMPQIAPKPQRATFESTHPTIVESLKLDPAFVRQTYILMGDYKSSRNPPDEV